MLVNFKLAYEQTERQFNYTQREVKLKMIGILDFLSYRNWD